MRIITKITLMIVLTAAVLPADSNLDAAVSVAAVFPGIVEASLFKGFEPESTVQFSNRISPALKLTAEYYILPQLGPCFAVHYAPLNFKEDIYLGYWDGRDHIIPGTNNHFIEVEAGIKYRIFLQNPWTLEPGLCLGYGHLFSDSEDARNNGFIVDCTAELQRQMDGYHLLATAGFMAQLYGGVEGIAYVRSYPVLYLAAGIGL